MTIYRLHTNEGEFYVRQNPRDGKIPYIKEKLAKGWKLSDILYTWAPLQVHHTWKQIR